MEKEFFEKTRPSSPIQRFAETSEVAALVAFVASSVASAINGVALRVEGGLVRSIAHAGIGSVCAIGYNFGQNEAVNVNRKKQSYGSGFLQSI